MINHGVTYKHVATDVLTFSGANPGCASDISTIMLEPG